MMKISLKIIFGLVVMIKIVDATTLSKSYTLSSAVQSYIVGLHNTFRSSVANGKVGTQPKGADMQAMSWDPTLASYAQTNANKCAFTHSNAQSMGYGENMAAGTLNTPLITDTDLQTALSVNFKPSQFAGVDTWTDENLRFSYPTCQSGQVCGHYTQLAWASTNKVGCAIAQCNGMSGGWPLPETQLAYLILCNYTPPGNMGMLNATTGAIYMPPPYKSGTPCSSCPTSAKTCSTSGLCSI